MLILGIIIGPYGLIYFNRILLMYLMIKEDCSNHYLLRAGLGINKDVLRKIEVVY